MYNYLLYFPHTIIPSGSSSFAIGGCTYPGVLRSRSRSLNSLSSVALYNYNMSKQSHANYANQKYSIVSVSYAGLKITAGQ